LAESPALPRKKGRAALWGALGAAAAGAMLALSNSGVAAVTHKPESVEDKLDGVRDDLRALRTDVAVIKRQLGLDGLGPPPPQVRISRP
jgi:hypothetical protein